MSSATLETIARAPAGSLLSTTDGAIVWHKFGPGKTDWEKTRPDAERGWRPLSPPERGSRVFVEITRRREPLVLSRSR